MIKIKIIILEIIAKIQKKKLDRITKKYEKTMKKINDIIYNEWAKVEIDKI